MHAPLLLIRPLARARHLEGTQGHAGPRVQSGPPREMPVLLLSTTRSSVRVAVRAWVVKISVGLFLRKGKRSQERLIQLEIPI
jgi:hypothetical protein